MDWTAVAANVTGILKSTALWAVGLGAVFALLARLFPCNPGMFWWTDLRAAVTDAVYWFAVPIFLLVARTVMLVAGIILVFGGHAPGVLPVGGWPLWQQAVAVLIVQDFLQYWIHRLFHTSAGWGFHAVHHSPEVLDWTSAVRFHPVNTLFEFALADVIVVLLGFSPGAVAALAPFNFAYSAMVHANLNWTFGPFRYVLASPVFHRWHHTSQAEGRDTNFAPTFPFLDLVFGTYHMPPGVVPEQFGAADSAVPTGFWGQLAFPARGARPVAWARRRPVMAGLTTAGVLAAGGLFYSRALNPVAVVGMDADPAAGAGQEESAAALPVYQIMGGNDVTAAAVGTGLVVRGEADGKVSATDFPAGVTRAFGPGHPARVTAIAVSGDGKWVVSAARDGSATVWDATSGVAARTLTGPTGRVVSLALSPDGRCVAAGCVDGLVRVWERDAGAPRTLTGGAGAVTAVAVSPDGRYVVGASQTEARVWDLRENRETTLKGHTDLVYAVAVSPSGERVVTGGFDRQVKVWDAAAGREVATLAGHTSPVYCVTVSPDGRRVGSGDQDGTLKLWDLGTGREVVALTGHPGAVHGIAISADAGRVVTASRNGTVTVWDAGSHPHPAGATARGPSALPDTAAAGTR